MLKMEPFIKTMGTPYIPGSSLKGAIRTAVLNHWAEDEHGDEDDILNTKLPNKWGDPEPVIGRDVFKYLKLPDIPLGKDFTFFGRIANFNLKYKELRETGIQLLREVTRSQGYPMAVLGAGDNCFPFEMQLDEEVMKDKRSVKGRDDLTFAVIWKSLDFYGNLLSRESKKWFSLNSNLDRFYGGFNEFLESERKVEDIKVMKIGFGSGYDAVIIEKLSRQERQPRPHGKSINLFEAQSPLGWVVLRRV
jgi:CRISPR type III-A-associated RAMP protein Csm5